MAKANKGKDRREVVEQLRREQQRAEKKRTTLIVGAAAVVGLVIVGAGAYPLLSDPQRELAKSDLAALGVSADAASCTDVVAEKAEGNNDHREPGTKIEYSSSPPAAGPHYPDWAPMARKFYSADDRPALEQLVHNLEHGYNILWYDDTIAEDEEKLAQVEAIANKFPGNEYENKFIAAPWTAEDGDPFPDGAHIALTHWSMGGTNGNPEGQHGITQYCAEPSGEAVAAFVEDYPYTDAPEPGAS
ncbi:MAG TPA: DUF3105 domain-containing protein [Nocardioidaceae bacterium]